MGKPRMIILVRHAQSEGNRNRNIHQYIPDHRVQLTAEGKLQAREAGRRLRELLRPDDTIRFVTSPYRRTRDTTAGMIDTLTQDDSPFKKEDITIYEEPRLREQDFGNFQPCSAEMSRIWQERASYGHFFYRIPNGESAADAYDRVSGFNESLWRQFGDEDFPSVCVLVTHGLMTRVFLMKWYHWTVEQFEDLRNINHCEFIKMRLNDETGKYRLENTLRTWSDLNRSLPPSTEPESHRPRWSWGGCSAGCNHKANNEVLKNRYEELKRLADQQDEESLEELTARMSLGPDDQDKQEQTKATHTPTELVSPESIPPSPSSISMSEVDPRDNAPEPTFTQSDSCDRSSQACKSSKAPDDCSSAEEKGCGGAGSKKSCGRSRFGSTASAYDSKYLPFGDPDATTKIEELSQSLSFADLVNMSGMQRPARAERLGDARSDSEPESAKQDG